MYNPTRPKLPPTQITPLANIFVPWWTHFSLSNKTTTIRFKTTRVVWKHCTMTKAKFDGVNLSWLSYKHRAKAYKDPYDASWYKEKANVNVGWQQQQKNRDESNIGLSSQLKAPSKSSVSTVQNGDYCTWKFFQACKHPELPLENYWFDRCDNTLHHLCQITWKSENNVPEGPITKYCLWHDAKASCFTANVSCAKARAPPEWIYFIMVGINYS